MKNILLLLIALSIQLHANSQSVPNTTTFSLQNVVDVVNPTTDDLVDCFSDANATYFNATYEGSKNSLLNFRDYGPHNSCPVIQSGSGFFSSTSTTITVNTPAVYSGDILVIILGQIGNTTITTPTGWTRNSVSASYSNTINGNTFHKLITSTTSASSVNIVSSANSNKIAFIYRISGVTTSLFRYESFSSNIPYSTRNMGGYAGTACKMGVAVLLVKGNIAPTLNPATGWSNVTSTNTSAAGGWGMGVQSYSYSSSVTSPDTNFSLSVDSYLCEIGFLVD